MEKKIEILWLYRSRKGISRLVVRVSRLFPPNQHTRTCTTIWVDGLYIYIYICYGDSFGFLHLIYLVT